MNHKSIKSTEQENGPTLLLEDELAAYRHFCRGIPFETVKDGSLADYICEQAFLSGVHVIEDRQTAGFNGLAMQMLASSFAGQFKGSGAINYLELQASHPEVGNFCITMQRHEGKTPSQLQHEAERERDGLKIELDAVKSKLEKLKASGLDDLPSDGPSP